MVALALDLVFLYLDSLTHSNVTFFNESLCTHCRINFGAFVDITEKIVDNFLFVLQVNNLYVEFGRFLDIDTSFFIFHFNIEVKSANSVIPFLVSALPCRLSV